MAGPPHGDLLVPCVQVLHVTFHLLPEIHIAVQQILRVHLRAFFHYHGQGIPVNDLAFLHLESVALQKRRKGLKCIIGNVVPDQLKITVVVHDIFKAGNRDQSHRIILKIAVNGLEHGARIRLVLKEVKGEENIIKTSGEPGVLRFSKPFHHIQSLRPGQLHQMGIVLDSMGLHGKFSQHLKKLALAAAHLNEPLSLQMIILDQILILIPAQFHHGFGKTSCPYHIPVIVHRIAVKLDQAAAHALTQIQGQPLVL